MQKMHIVLEYSGGYLPVILYTSVTVPQYVGGLFAGKQKLTISNVLSVSSHHQ
jgi:hypothetical protein